MYNALKQAFPFNENTLEIHKCISFHHTYVDVQALPSFPKTKLNR
jgi:hypothetical protein